jgi:hypothetical protein
MPKTRLSLEDLQVQTFFADEHDMDDLVYGQSGSQTCAPDFCTDAGNPGACSYQGCGSGPAGCASPTLPASRPPCPY